LVTIAILGEAEIRPGLPDSLGATYQNGKIYQMAKNIPNDTNIDLHNNSKKDQMTIKYTNIFLRNILQNLPKVGYFGFENIPSGNPGFGANLK
jgi:hypothetical protein